MDNQTRLTRGTMRIALWAVVALFLIPGLTYAFSGYILGEWDQKFASAVMQKVTPDKRADAEAFIGAAKPSEICGATHPQLAGPKAEMCAPFSNIWQVSMARSVAFAALIGGAAMLALVLLLSMAAFGSRNIQYASFVTGKQVMIWGSAAEVLVQGLMLVWLSFWVTAFFFNVYIVKLILIVAAMVGLAALAAVAGIFKRNRAVNTQHGELITEADAPTLWRRIRQMAEKLQTAPPKQIVAGIDANFFVTEAPLKVGDVLLTGRTLYVSLPLLRKLETIEADAVLAHELAHLGGGDTANSAKLGPALQHYDQYLASMRQGGTTIVVWPLLALYRIMFERALARSSREREFRADRVASHLVSPQGIAKSLVKVAAYSLYRAKVEGDLFTQQTQHTGALGIASAIDSGLANYVHSPAFVEKISAAHVPHPFDSHPPLQERLQAMGAPMTAQDFSAVAAEVPASSWVGDISTADAVEGRLWSVFEQAFTAEHERVLAYRYKPSSDDEREVVLKYFPLQRVQLKENVRIDISYEGILSSEIAELIPWGAVNNIAYKSGSFGDSITVTVFDFQKPGKRSIKIRLPKIGARKEEFKAVIGAYWRRHQIMTQLQGSPVEPATQ